MAERICDHNPCGAVRIAETKRRERALPIKDVRRVLQAVKGTGLDGPVFAALVLGLRRGEVCGLKRSHLDGKARRVMIIESRVATPSVIPGRKGKVRDKATKTGRSRPFVLPESLWNELTVRLSHRDSEYAFTSPSGRAMHPERITSMWKQGAAELGLAEWTFHDLRHGAAGTLAALGVDLLTIAAVPGHREIDTTMLYAAAQEATASDGLNKVGEALFPAEKE